MTTVESEENNDKLSQSKPKNENKLKNDEHGVKNENTTNQNSSNSPVNQLTPNDSTARQFSGTAEEPSSKQPKEETVKLRLADASEYHRYPEDTKNANQDDSKDKSQLRLASGSRPNTHGSSSIVQKIPTEMEQNEKRESFMSRFTEYTNMINGIARELNESEEAILDDIFHDDCTIIHGDDLLHKSKWKQTMADMIRNGRQAKVTDIRWIDDLHHLDFKVRFTSDLQLHLLQHNICTLKDDKIVHIEPFREIAHQEILRDGLHKDWLEFLETFSYPNDAKFTAIQDKLFDRIYHNDFQMIYDGNQTSKGGYKAAICSLRQKCTCLEVLQLEWIDEVHCVYKARMFHNDWSETTHSIATLKGGQIIHTQSFRQSMYMQLAKAAFERNFRDYVTLPFDDRTYERTIHDNYNIVFNGEPLDKAAWKQIINGFSKRNARVELILFRWMDDNHFEYKFRQTFRDYSVRIPHAIGTIQDWKLVRSEPVKNAPMAKGSVSSTPNCDEDDGDSSSDDPDSVPGAFRVPGLSHTISQPEENDQVPYGGDAVIDGSALVQAEVAPDMADMLEAARAEGRRQVEEERQEERRIIVVATKSETKRYSYVILGLVSITIAVVVGLTVGRVKM